MSFPLLKREKVVRVEKDRKVKSWSRETKGEEKFKKQGPREITYIMSVHTLCLFALLACLQTSEMVHHNLFIENVAVYPTLLEIGRTTGFPAFSWVI